MQSSKEWDVTRDKYLSLDEVRCLRRSSEDRALADLAEGRTGAVRAWAVIDLSLSTGLQLLFKRQAERVGLSSHFSIHACRPSYGAYLYQKPKDLAFVQDQPGYSSPIVTQVYSHIIPAQRARSVNGLWNERRDDEEWGGNRG